MAADYFVILVLVSAFGAFLFLASTLIFLVEEVAKYLIHLVRELAGDLHDAVSHPAKASAPIRPAIHDIKP